MMRKSVVFTLCVLVIVGMMIGCKGKKSNEGAVSQETPASSGAVTQAPGQAVGSSSEAPADLGTVKSVTVNGQVIDEAAIDKELKQFAVQLKMRIPAQQFDMIMPKMRGKSVESLISRILLLEEADKAGITVKPEDVQAKYEEVRGTFPSVEKFDDYMKELGMTEAVLMDALTVQIKAETILNQKIGDQIKVSEQDIQDYYKQNSASFSKTDRLQVGEIMIKVDPAASKEERAEKRAKAEQVLKELEAGADFADLAYKYSDSGSKERGGVLGVIEPGRTEPAFEQAAYSLQEGQHSGVVETMRGFHIIKAMERLESIDIPLAEVQEGIKRLLETFKQQQVMQEYINTLKEKATITYE